ncbi:MAG: hypothetical protein NTW52_19315 [Planctomycetota bacterium]|nr:hypothetical protein [Planctomycetota bacterium]
MTTKPKISKSRLALEYLESHPGATVKDVVAALSQYEVKLSDVNNAKQKLRATSPKRASTGPKKRGPKPGKAAKATADIAAKTPKKRGRKPLKRTAVARSPNAASKAAVPSGGAYSTIEAGLRFIEATGSIESARELLSLIEQIKKA